MPRYWCYPAENRQTWTECHCSRQGDDKQIRTRMVSQRRNELIADIFHRGRFVERWGRGISLILSKEPTAEFEEIGESFYVTLKKAGLVKG